MAPASAASQRLKRPTCTRNPAYGMISSDGSGMHADSIAISSATPGYPNVEITVTTNVCSARSIESIMDLGTCLKRKGVYSLVPSAVSYADTASETSVSQLLQI